MAMFVITLALGSLMMGFVFVRWPKRVIERQIAVYRRINWRMEPISWEKEIRNTRLMGFAVMIVAIAALLCGVAASGFAQEPVQAQAMSLTFTSVAFHEGAGIPSIYTCEGKDISPPLAWTDPPEGTKGFALISDDPDAPMGTWVHWVVYDLPPTTRQLPEAFPTDAQLKDGTRQGTTDFGRTGYGGPCPPSGTHRYVFKLYALDAMLDLKPGATKAKLEAAMNGHILAQAALMGTYRRKGR